MSSRLLSVLGLSLVMLATACSSDGKLADPEAMTPEAPPAKAAPKFTKFEDFPGQELLYTRSMSGVTFRVKPVDATWTPELAFKPAKAGEHFLAVYVAATGELADRGVTRAELSGLQVRVKPSGADCSPVTGEDYCFFPANPSSQLEKVADNEWRRDIWADRRYVGSDIDRGATVVGVAGFSVPDKVTGGPFELCAPTEKKSLYASTFPCVAIKTPDGSRN